MTENPFIWPWPNINIESVNTEWWDEVMEATSFFSIPEQLNDSQDFTLRYMLFLITNKTSDEVQFYLEGSMQVDRAVAINKLLNHGSAEGKEKGRDAIYKMIDEYSEDMLSGR